MEDPETTEDPPFKVEPEIAAKDKAAALIGRVVSQRYKIIELLAMGGMGAVYRGEHLLLKKRIAIKILHPEIENLPELVTRFEREAIAGAHIQHPNVAAATDFGQLEDGSFFLVLEYVRGTTLYHAIKKGRFEPARAGHIARQLASGLAAAHAMGVVHRDVKPRNVMLIEGQEDHAKLIDFGLAKVSVDELSAIESRRSFSDETEKRAHASRPDHKSRGSQSNEGDRLTDVGVIFGTIAYLAPEAALGMDAVDARADLYALGVILYEMLAGVHPFQGADPIELFKHQRYSLVPPFAERVPGLSVDPPLEAVVMRLLAKDPAARFQTGKELIDALDAALDPPTEAASAAAPVSPRPATPTPREEAPTEPAIEGSDVVIVPAVVLARAASLPSSQRAKVQTKGKLAGGDGAPPRTPVPPKKVSKPIAAEKKRRPPYLETALLLGIAAVGLFMFTRLRFQPHLTPRPPPATPVSAPLEPSASAAPDPSIVAPIAPPSAEPSASEVPEDAASAASIAPDASDSIDAAGQRALLIRAARTHDWPNGEVALLALADRDPASFSRIEVGTAARDVAAGLEHDGNGDKVFDALANRVGEGGLSVLYDIVQAKGGSRAATRAGDLLRQDAVKARETPALRIAFELRDASCVDKLKLLDRAVKEGDGRALVVLQGQGVACFRKSREVDQAISELKAKLIKR